MAFQKQTLPEAVCEQLREAILAQRWRNKLPGIRILCDEIQVSRETMMLALRLLEKEGFVKPAVHGKPRSIIQETVSPAKPTQKNKSAPVIVVIAWRNETELSEADFAVCSNIRKLLESQGFVHRHLAYRYIMRAMGAKNIDHLVEQNPADVYVVISAHPQCSRAFKRLGVPVIYIGGKPVKGCVPRISSSLSQMCDVSITHLASAGHRKICVMLPEGINSAAKKESYGEELVEQIFRQNKLPFSTYNCPRWGVTKSDFNTALEQLFHLTPPTALILGSVSHVARVVCFLMRHKLSYPDDVSIIVIDEANELREYQPPISCLKGNKRFFAKSVLNLVRKKLASQPDQELIIAPTELVVTDSIAEVLRK